MLPSEPCEITDKREAGVCGYTGSVERSWQFTKIPCESDADCESGGEGPCMCSCIGACVVNDVKREVCDGI